MTHLELLNKLPSPYREQAIENNTEEFLQSSSSQILRKVIQYGFSWTESPQGYDYWLDIYNRADNGEFNDPSVTLPMEDWHKVLGLITAVEDFPQFSVDAKAMYDAIQSQLNKTK